MALTADHVRELAALARMDLADEEIGRLAGQLDAILAKVASLGPMEDVEDLPVADPGSGDRAAPLRPDTPGAEPLDVPLAELAPGWGDGFFTVPRLTSHAGPEGS